MPDNPADPCRACGACCSFSDSWPLFTTDSERDIAAIPAAFIRADHAGMHCTGTRCSALTGNVGTATGCSIYAARPDVCRACRPGDVECNIARQSFGLSALAA
jgi:Fe-S-cluster containining protein